MGIVVVKNNIVYGYVFFIFIQIDMLDFVEGFNLGGDQVNFYGFRVQVVNEVIGINIFSGIIVCYWNFILKGVIVQFQVVYEDWV